MTFKLAQNKLTISSAATLLRVFAASDDDVLQTPAPVESTRVTNVPGLPRPRLSSVGLETLPAAARVLAWGETEDCASLRRRVAKDARSPSTSTSTSDKSVETDVGQTIAKQLWRTKAGSAESAARVHHRGFCVEVADAMRRALPGARLVRGPDEVVAHLEAGGAATAPGEKWVLKAPYSAAGRLRVLGSGVAFGDGPERRQADRLFELYGSLLFEPWMERLEDFGACAIISEAGVKTLGAHRLQVDRAGRFRGVTVRVGKTEAPGLLEDESEALDAVLREVARQCLGGVM